MDHVLHILDRVFEGLDCNYPLLSEQEKKEFGTLRAPKYSAFVSWSMMITPDSSGVLMTQQCGNQHGFLPISMDERIQEINDKDNRLIVTIGNEEQDVLYSVIFCPGENLFDISGLIPTLIGVFDKDFVTKSADMDLSPGLSVSKVALRLTRLIHNISGKRPDRRHLQRGVGDPAGASEVTLTASTVTPRDRPSDSTRRRAVPAPAPSRAGKRQLTNPDVPSPSSKRPRVLSKPTDGGSSGSALTAMIP